MRRAATIAFGLVVGAATAPGLIAGACIACSSRRKVVDVDAVLACIEKAAAWDD